MNLISPYDILCYHVGKWYQSSAVYAVSELDAMLLDNVVLCIANFYFLFSWETSVLCLGNIYNKCKFYAFVPWIVI